MEYFQPKIKAVLVDDESSAITTLRGMIEKFCPNVEIIGICQDYHSAVDLVHKQTPDLVFLDIQISPIHSGFDFLEQTRDRPFGTIFTTAYAEYAVKAINRFQPWSYLVKPFSVADLLDAVKVANQKLREIHQQKAAQSLDQKFEFIDIFKKHHLIRARDVKYLQINDSIISLYYCTENTERKLIVTGTLKEMEDKLPEAHFCRVHNSFILNLNHIKSYEKNGRGYIVFLSGDVHIPVAVHRVPHFEQSLNSIWKD